MSTTTREFLAEAALSGEMVDKFLDPQNPNWAVFDEELGYRLRDSVCKDGVHGSYYLVSKVLSICRQCNKFADLLIVNPPRAAHPPTNGFRLAFAALCGLGVD